LFSFGQGNAFAIRMPPISTSRKASLSAVFLTLFLDILGFSLVLPFLGEEARKSFHTTAFVGSLLASVYSLMQFLFVPVWGRLSDRIGRRPVMVWSIFATTLGNGALFAALIFGNHIGWLFAARIAAGIATANIGTAAAYIADVTTKETRAKGMAVIGVAFGFGFIIGPALGGYFADTWIIHGRSGALPCALSTAFSLVNFVWVLLGLKESLATEKRAKRSAGGFRFGLDLGLARGVLKRPQMGVVILVNFVIVLSFTSLDQTFRFYCGDLFGFSSKQTGMVFGFIGVSAALVQGGLVRRLSGRVPEARMIRAGLFAQALAFAGLAVAPNIGVPAIYVACFTLALGNGLSQPSVSAFISKRAGDDEQGAVLGVSQGIASLGRAIGPALGGFLYDSVSPRFPYQAASAGMLLGLILAWSLGRDSK
jgi:MFS transporter, DHA1 family, tetracycline resistance protein